MNGCGRVMGHGMLCANGECHSCQEIAMLKQHIIVARKALEDLAQPCTRADYKLGDLDRVVVDRARKALSDMYKRHNKDTTVADIVQTPFNVVSKDKIKAKEAIQKEEDIRIFDAIHKAANEAAEKTLETTPQVITTIIRLKTNKDGIFSTERISGKREDLEAEGFKILGKESEDSYMWDFENVDVIPPDKDFEVTLHFDIEDDGCGDISFEKFALGYVDVDEFEIISGFNPFDHDENEVEGWSEVHELEKPF